MSCSKHSQINFVEVLLCTQCSCYYLEQILLQAKLYTELGSQKCFPFRVVCQGVAAHPKYASYSLTYGVQIQLSEEFEEQYRV